MHPVAVFLSQQRKPPDGSISQLMVLLLVVMFYIRMFFSWDLCHLEVLHVESQEHAYIFSYSEEIEECYCYCLLLV